MRPAAVESGLIDLDDQTRRPLLDDAPVAHQAAVRRKIDLITHLYGFARQAELGARGQSRRKKEGGKGHGDREGLKTAGY